MFSRIISMNNLQLQVPRLLGKLGVVICCVVGVFLPLFLNHPVQGQINSPEINQMRSQQQQLQQQRQQIIQERDRLINLQTEAEKRLQGLNTNLQTTNSQIQDSEQRLKIATERLKTLQTQLQAAETAYISRQQATIARLRFLQRSPKSHGWAILLQSQNLNDFIRRRRYLKSVYESDQKILAELTTEANLLLNQKTAVEAAKNETELIRQQLLAQKADFQAQAQQQDQLIQRLNNDKIALSAAETKLAEDSATIGKMIAEKVAAMQARAAAAKALGKSFTSGTGIFAFPSNARISSGFGWRMHPILGYQRFHSGIDFADSYGSPIRAADSGVVIFAGWHGSYGRTVIISHGNDITTLYAHCSELHVYEGQNVQRGQIIANIGSTGLSTGPHLHFEVRRSGTPIDPAPYL